MNYFALPSIVAFVFALFFGNLVYYKNPKKLLNRMFLLLCLLDAYWALTEYGHRSAHNYETALFWLRVATLWPF